MTKVITKTLRCGTTGEFRTVKQVVRMPEAINASRAAMEARFDAEAAAEAGAMRQHRILRPDVQKIGWMGRGAK